MEKLERRSSLFCSVSVLCC